MNEFLEMLDYVDILPKGQSNIESRYADIKPPLTNLGEF